MATISYTFVDRCGGGGHTQLDISLNSGAPQRVTYDTDVVRAPLGDLTTDEREMLVLLILKVHMAGKTRPQIVAEFQGGPVTVNDLVLWR